MEVLERELKALEKDKDAFIEDFSEVRFSSNFFSTSSLLMRSLDFVLILDFLSFPPRLLNFPPVLG